MIALSSSFLLQSFGRRLYAPAWYARSEKIWTVCMVSTRTFVPGNLDLMIRVASIPSSTGMLMSISAAHSLCFSTAWMAARPSGRNRTCCQARRSARVNSISFPGLLAALILMFNVISWRNRPGNVMPFIMPGLSLSTHEIEMKLHDEIAPKISPKTL